MKHTLNLSVKLLLLVLLTGCCQLSRTTDKPKYPRVPYWVDGISNVTSRMLDKNLFWLDKIDQKLTSRSQERDLINSNTRFFRLLIEYIRLQKENERLQEENPDEETLPR